MHKDWKMDKFLYCLKEKGLDFFSTLKETSYDKENSEYLCNDTTQKVLDFDKIVKEKYPNKQPSSVDTVLILSKKEYKRLYLVEFKNQIPSRIDNSEVKKKLENSIDVIKDILQQCNISKKGIKFTYCIVFKSSKSRWRKGIEKNSILFGLEAYKNNLIDDIFTNDVRWMTKEYTKIFKQKLYC